jgi:hypothetical protein
VSVAQNVDPNKIISIPLMDPSNNINYVTTTTIEDAYGNPISYVVSAAGMNDFSDIHKYISGVLSGEGWVMENAVIDVLNGSGVTGLGASKAKDLKNYGLSVGVIDTAPTDNYTGVTIYKVDNNSPETAKKLSEIYGVNVQDIAAAPTGVAPSSNADFVIIFGQ